MTTSLKLFPTIAIAAASLITWTSVDVQPAAAFAGQITLLNDQTTGPIPAAQIPLNVTDIAVEPDGSILLGLHFGLARVDTAGAYTLLTPNINGGALLDGTPLSEAHLGAVTALASDESAIYLTQVNRITRVDRATGIVSRFAGIDANSYNGDGPALERYLGGPRGLTVDPAGRVVFTEYTNSDVRQVVNGHLSLVAGTGSYSLFGGDGRQARSAYLARPNDVVVDAQNRILVADTKNHAIRRIDTNGVITTIAGTGATPGYSGDGGPATAAQLRRPESLAVDATGNVFIADTDNDVIRRVDAATGIITTVAGTGVKGFDGDGGAATTAAIHRPFGLAIDAIGRVLFVQEGHWKSSTVVRRFTVGGTIESVAGNGGPYYAISHGPVSHAGIGDWAAMALDTDGGLLLGDSGAIRTIHGERIDLLYGRPNAGTYTYPLVDRTSANQVRDPSGDGGPAQSAVLTADSIIVDPGGNRYLSDTTHHRIRRITPAGLISTVVGDGTPGYDGDGGSATAARVDRPRGLGLDPNGGFYFVDAGNSVVRHVDAAGVITTVAGGGANGDGGDGGPALAATLDSPWDVAADVSGNLYVSTATGVRKVLPTAIITTVLSKTHYSPKGLAIDPAGNLFVADSDRLVVVSPAGMLRVIASGPDGPDRTPPDALASSVSIGSPYEVSVAPNGDVYILSHRSEPGFETDDPSSLYRIEGAAAAEYRTYVPVEPVPVRLVDTRIGVGGRTGPVAGGVEFSVQVTDANGVALDASAVAVNVTGVGASIAGYVTVYPCGAEPQPPTSNLNYAPERIVANAAIVSVGAGGRICLKTLTDVDLVVDLQGWYTARTDLRATKPVRLADTRIGLGIAHALTAGVVTRLQVAGVAGVPADAGAVVVNVTAVDATAEGFVAAYPCGGPVPLASNLNLWPGHAIANLAFVGIGDGGDICVYSNVATELVVDVQGWFYDVASYHPLTPYRAYDSRDHGSGVAAGSVLEVPVRYDRVPDRADVVVVNVTAVDATGPAFVTVYPCGEPAPLVSNNNTSSDRTVATTVLARVGSNGRICLTSNLDTHLVVDINGWQDATRTIGP
jgi:sugar lactone lactonase YvrE